MTPLILSPKQFTQIMCSIKAAEMTANQRLINFANTIQPTCAFEQNILDKAEYDCYALELEYILFDRGCITQFAQFLYDTEYSNKN